MDIFVNVRGKVATATSDARIVCGNSDYVIVFDFDEPWQAYDVKTARFSYLRDGARRFEEVVFTGNECQVPVLRDTLEVKVGVYAGDLSTTTAALVRCERSILCGAPVHDDPPRDVYNQINEHLRNISEKTAPATTETYGTVKVYTDEDGASIAGGIVMRKNGVLEVVPASEVAIDGRSNPWTPIVPANLEYAVKSVGDPIYAKVEDFGDIEAALDGILAMQEALIGGDA